MDLPYISFVLATRNDDHGGNLLKRIERFIHFLDISFNDASNNFYELVVVDWNPPDYSKKISDAINWSKINNVRHVVVESEVHTRIELSAKLKRPMYDYLARNVGINNARGHFICILNQDIILSSKLSEFIKKRRLKNDYFYRADRIDTNFPLMIEKLDEGFLLSNVTQINRRHKKSNNITLNYIRNLSQVQSECSAIKYWSIDSIIEKGIGKNNIRSKYYLSKFKSNSLEILITKLGLHTNASGDFLIASRNAWHSIGGFESTTDFYMHIDSYCVCKFWAAGFKQALFKYPAYVFHCNHDLSDHASKEVVTYSYHREILQKILTDNFKQDDKFP